MKKKISCDPTSSNYDPEYYYKEMNPDLYDCIDGEPEMKTFAKGENIPCNKREFQAEILGPYRKEYLGCTPKGRWALRDGHTTEDYINFVLENRQDAINAAMKKRISKRHGLNKSDFNPGSLWKDYTKTHPKKLYRSKLLKLVSQHFNQRGGSSSKKSKQFQSDDDDSDHEEEYNPKIVPKQVPKKTSKQIKLDDDDDEEIVVKNVPKAVPKQIKLDDDDDEEIVHKQVQLDDDDEEIVPMQKFNISDDDINKKFLPIKFNPNPLDLEKVEDIEDVEDYQMPYPFENKPYNAKPRKSFKKLLEQFRRSKKRYELPE